MARPLSPLSVRLTFWEGVDAGLSVAVAAQAAGVSRPTGYRWLSEHQKVLPSPVQDFSVARVGLLSLREREEIGFQLARGHGVRRIAAALGRAPSTISREVTRNQVAGRYVPSLAQEQTWARARRPRARRLDGLALRKQVATMLTDRFSPEQVAGRLKVKHPENPEMQVSHETIYQALYVQGRGSLRLEVVTALRSGRATRRPQRPEGPRPQRFQEMVMISDRPPEIEDRAVPGHWEGDLIIGSTSSKSAIGTLVERTTGYVMLLHLPGDHTARTVADAMIVAMNTLPEQLRRSTTWDQGAEMSRHQEITMATGMPIYFCDPHSPWQRGSNENTNGLLREYFPKGTDLSFHGPGILENVAAELNRRPRKRHGYRTPAEVLATLISNPTNQTGVADTT
ncbi:IS30 family transposase [Cryobacterium sp. GrIS_2_6]|uniref:IS30 family transposase n=1 Tax=Cryobacterium sp. GrIS_2_6 TaxID=3162785 RepID=UPI002E0B365E|nr:IS30 family transposase [Cryobacterium psychrotolerans]MEC5152519.1 IS30 family transposase [Cryobacterium psychrotolerans]